MYINNIINVIYIFRQVAHNKIFTLSIRLLRATITHIGTTSNTFFTVLKMKLIKLSF
jgi:hypothetical protein